MNNQAVPETRNPRPETRIKICGLTSLADAVCAAEAGADAIGFVFAESPRRMEPKAVRAILAECDQLPPGVGVFVDTPAEEARRVLRASGCAVAQLHGAEPAECIDLTPGRMESSRACACGAGLWRGRSAALRGAQAILLDAYVAGQAGGTGRSFDPECAVGLCQRWRIVMAGGLNPDTVGEVIRKVRPYGVDVSSGVESAPGKKDHLKMRDFVAAVRAVEREV